MTKQRREIRIVRATERPGYKVWRIMGMAGIWLNGSLVEHLEKMRERPAQAAALRTLAAQLR